MWVDVRDQKNRRVGRVEIDLTQMPTRVRPEGLDHDLFLDWEGALDDSGNLRRCLICQYPHLYKRKNLPQLTPFVILLAFAGATLGILGFADNPLVMGSLVLLLVIDIGMLLIARPQLACYKCHSVYSKTQIARYHRLWQRDEEQRATKQDEDGPSD